MKNIFAVLVLSIFFATTGYSQLPSTKPAANSYHVFSQMWSTSNVYRNTPTTGNLGTQVDTSGPATLYTYYAGFYSGVANADTFIPNQLPAGSGTIVFTVTAWKGQLTSTTVNPIIVSTPQSSSDGVSWADIPGVTSLTITPTSATQSAALTKKIYITTRQDDYFRMKNVVTVDTAAIQNTINFQRTLNTVINK